LAKIESKIAKTVNFAFDLSRLALTVQILMLC